MMKKRMILSFTLVLALLLTGCQNGSFGSQESDSMQAVEQEQVQQSTTTDEEQTEEEDTSTLPEEAVQEEQEQEQESTQEQEEDSAQTDTSETAEAEREALLERLNELRESVRVGTAGSSLAAAQQAANLLDWGMDTTLSAEEIQSAVQEWYSAIDPADEEEVQMQLSAVASAVEQVTGADGADLLDSAGCTESQYPWNDTAKEAALTAMTAVPTEE